MCTYASSRVKRKSFYRKSELQIFLLISGGHIGAPKRCTNMASPYKALQRCVYVSANNSETVGYKDLRLGKIVCIIVFYNISFSWLLPLDGFRFIFLFRDSENDLQEICNRIEIVPFSSLDKTDEDAKEQLLQEIEIMKSIGYHKNVVSMLGCWVNNDPIFLLLEYVPYGDLRHWLINKRKKVRVSQANASRELIMIIIHSQYFPDSDWLKAHA